MCYHLTRFTREELKTLYHLFFGAFPDNSYTFCTVKFTYEETMLISLDCMANGTKYIAMSQVYGGDWSRYSYIVNWFTKFLYHKYYHSLCGRSLSYWINRPNIDKFRHEIFNYVKHDQSDITIRGLEHMMQEYFWTFGFLDCMQLAMCKPGSGPINSDDERNPEMWRLQRAFLLCTERCGE